jgi:sugar lactone lactonase YvrE
VYIPKKIQILAVSVLFVVALTACGGGSGSVQSTTGGVTTTPAKVTVVAGSATTNINPADGTGTAAIFWGGGHLAIDASGNIIVSDNGALRKVTQAGVVTTLSPGYPPFVWEGIAVDGAGDIFGSGSLAWALFSVNGEFSPTWGASVNEMTVSGTLKYISVNWETSTTDSAVGFGGLAVDSSGSLYLADGANNRIVKFTSAGIMSIFAGSGTSGSNDGVGASATFNNPTDLASDANGNLYVNDNGSSSQRDSGTSTIRKITPDGKVSTLIQMQSPQGPIAVDASGNIYTVVFPQTILRIDPLGNVTMFSVPGISDFITALATDGKGNLYAGTRGIGAQILKISF